MTAYDKISDAQLTGFLKSGDHTAFTEIFNRYSGLMYAHAYNKLRNEDEAREVVQEMFVNIWGKRETINLSPNLVGYLYTAVRNNIFNLIKHKKIVSIYAASFSVIDEQSGLVTDELIRTKQFAALIESEIAALPPRMRQVFELRRKENLSIKEVALKLQITESTVADQMKKALRILRLKLGVMVIFASFLF